MTPVTIFSMRKVAVFGLGGSGIATARALIFGGAAVSAWDDSPSARLEAQKAGITLVDLTKADFAMFDALILAPGVPLTHPAPHWSVIEAQMAGIEVIGDIELFCRERQLLSPRAPFVGITGTNGKSTTTALISYLLRSARRQVAMGGNIGTPVLDLPPPSESIVHVLEISSFQIDLTPSLNPNVGILLNITPDHLDRHGTMDVYVKVKETLIEKSDVAIIGADDDYCRAIATRRELAGLPLIRISSERRLPDGICRDGTRIMMNRKGDSREIVDLAGVTSLRGEHNAQNAAAAIAACLALGLTEDEIRRGIKGFPGLAHRLEMVGRIGRAVAVNDSKATNADATEKALAAFSDGIYWIVGGRAKAGGITSLKPYFSRIERAYLIGEAAEDFADTLDGQVSYTFAETMDRAVELAAKDAAYSKSREPVILLSPACASYDQYSNFEERGQHFKDLIRDFLDIYPVWED